MRKACDLGILLGHTLLRIDHDKTHVRAVDCHRGTQHAVAFDIVVHLGLFSHTGGIDEDVFALLVFKVGVDGVARRAGDVADDHALGAEDAVRQRRFTDIGLADDGDLDNVVLFVLFLLRREILQTCVQQIARAVAVDSGNGDGIAETKVVKLVKIRIDPAGGVHLIDRQHDGLAGAQQHICDLLIGGRQAGLDIGEENDDIGMADGDLCLLAHER